MAAIALEVLPKVEQLSSRVIRILGLNPGPYTLQGTNTYLLGTGRRRILVDTGEKERPDYVGLLRDTLKEQQVTIDHILITHRHHDHIGGMEGVLGMLDTPPIVSKLRANREEEVSDQVKSMISYLSDGERIVTEGATVKVFATPGHTEDHMSLLLEEENAVFCGDCILGQGSAVFEDLHSYMASLKILLQLSPAVLYPGHGPLITKGTEMIANYIDHRNQRESQIIEVLKQSPHPLAASEIVTVIYKDITNPKLLRGAEHSVTQHLQKLRKEEQVTINKDKWELRSNL